MNKILALILVGFSVISLSSVNSSGNDAAEITASLRREQSELTFKVLDLSGISYDPTSVKIKAKFFKSVTSAYFSISDINFRFNNGKNEMRCLLTFDPRIAATGIIISECVASGPFNSSIEKEYWFYPSSDGMSFNHAETLAEAAKNPPSSR